MRLFRSQCVAGRHSRAPDGYAHAHAGRFLEGSAIEERRPPMRVCRRWPLSPRPLDLCPLCAPERPLFSSHRRVFVAFGRKVLIPVGFLVRTAGLNRHRSFLPRDFKSVLANFPRL